MKAFPIKYKKTGLRKKGLRRAFRGDYVGKDDSDRIFSTPDFNWWEHVPEIDSQPSSVNMWEDAFLARLRRQGHL